MIIRKLDFKFDLYGYKSLLCFLKKEKFKFKFFWESLYKGKNIIMRHDVDFCPLRALKIAEVEEKYKVKSTYFFLVNTNLYNIYSDLNKDVLKEILKKGHKIGLHFDASLYKKENELHQACLLELKILENLIKKKVQIISFHRPSMEKLSLNKKIANIEHTYMEKYTKRIDYCSDSQGAWRFSNPKSLIEKNNSKKNYCLHLLTHPIWWTTPSNLSPAKKIEYHINNYLEKYKKLAAKNCKPYSKHLRTLKK